MSARQTMIKYIAYHIKNLEPNVSKKEFRDFLVKKMGKSLEKATDDSIKKAAFTLYFAHFASLATCINSFSIITHLKTYSKIRDFIIANDKLRKEHGLPELYVIYHTKSSDIVKHMKKLDGDVAVIKSVMASDKKVVAKKVTVKKVAKKTSVKKVAKKPAAKKISAKKTSTKKVATKKTGVKKTCKDYNLTQLKKMAAKKEISGRSTMKKGELCKVLKIKTIM